MSIARDQLFDNARTLSNSIKLQFEADLMALDHVANLWRQDSNISRPKFREYVKSEFFQGSLDIMTSVILLHRVLDHQRDAVEADPGSVQVRYDCCNGTVYDLGEKACRDTAKTQCSIPGERFHFVALNTTSKTKDRAPPSPEYTVVMYQEPLENNPGPMGFDMQSHPARRSAWEAAAETGRKQLTKRVERIYSDRAEFGMLAWNPVFVDVAVDGNKTLFDGVELNSKGEWERQGKTPYAIGSVNGVYLLQNLFYKGIHSVFGKELSDTRAYLYDVRPGTEPDEALLAVYDPLYTADGLFTEAANNKALTLEQIKQRSEEVQVNAFTLDHTDVEFAVILEPSDRYFGSRITKNAIMVLLLSLGLVLAAQCERWLGHPSILSSEEVWRAKYEADFRKELEERIVIEAKQRAIEQAAAERAGGVQYSVVSQITTPGTPSDGARTPESNDGVPDTESGAACLA